MNKRILGVWFLVILISGFLPACSKGGKNTAAAGMSPKQVALGYLRAKYKIGDDRIGLIKVDDIKGIMITFKREDTGQTAAYLINPKEIIPTIAGIPQPEKSREQLDIVRLKGPMWRGRVWRSEISKDVRMALMRINSNTDSAVDSAALKAILVDKVLPAEGFAVDWRKAELKILARTSVMHRVEFELKADHVRLGANLVGVNMLIDEDHEVIDCHDLLLHAD